MISPGPCGHVIAIRMTSAGPSFTSMGGLVETARYLPSLKLVRTVLARSATKPAEGQGVCILQFQDFAESSIRSVAYSRRRVQRDTVGLIVDPYFFASRGYEKIRGPALEGQLPSWIDRLPIVFWRGSTTFYNRLDDNSFLASFNEIPRVKLCRRLAGCSGVDVQLSGLWDFDIFGDKATVEKMRSVFAAENILGKRVDMLEHAKYKYLIDIDGVASAWSFFEKLLLGSCILKIESVYEQWFYRNIEPWVHYVPVKSDLSDLVGQVEWCMSNDAQAERIALSGQQFALGHNFDLACSLSRSEIMTHRIGIA